VIERSASLQISLNLDGEIAAAALTPTDYITSTDLTPTDRTPNNLTTAAKPFYLIAHRVLTVQGIRDAIRHRANALEIDAMPYLDGWYASHDATRPARGDTMRLMFETVAEQRKAGKTISFVWLDLKHPDWCDPDVPKWSYCSVAELRELAKQILFPVGVQVLYGFSGIGSVTGRGYHYITRALDGREAVSIWDYWTDVKKEYEGSRLPFKARNFDRGLFNVERDSGDCESGCGTCNQLRLARESGAFNKVFGWTIATGQEWYVDKLMGTAKVDGLIYGFKATYYYDHEDTRTAAQSIHNWIYNNPGDYSLAGQNDRPWS
jgi:hypothetical protein